MLKFLDMFSGMGGFHAAFGRDDVCVGAIDKMRIAREAYELNYGITPRGRVEDVDPSDIEDFDVLCGGFPCQPFSIQGSRRALDDPRGVLFREIVRFLKAKRPKYFILENVKLILTIKGGSALKTILDEFKSAGYVVFVREFGAFRVGLPQNRHRVIFLGVREDVELFVNVPDPKNDYEKTERTMLDILEYPLDAEGTERFRAIYPRMVYGHDQLDDNERVRRYFEELINGELTRERRVRLLGYLHLLDENGQQTETKFKSIGRVHHPGGYSATVLKEFRWFRWGTDCIPTLNAVRALSVLEMQRIQGFPDDYKWPKEFWVKHKHQLLGQAVPPQMIRPFVDFIRENEARRLENE